MFRVQRNKNKLYKAQEYKPLIRSMLAMLPEKRPTAKVAMEKLLELEEKKV